MTREETFTVEERHLAPHVGSGAARVLATPWMIGFMEGTSHRLIAEHLPEGYSSVGVVVNVRHLAPTPAGSSVRVKAEVLAVDDRRITLRIQAWDSVELVGEGTHERYIIDVERFLRRVASKQNA
jgi:predicted thioesterase